jgi:hypothetical protein
MTSHSSEHRLRLAAFMFSSIFLIDHPVLFTVQIGYFPLLEIIIGFTPQQFGVVPFRPSFFLRTPFIEVRSELQFLWKVWMFGIKKPEVRN